MTSVARLQANERRPRLGALQIIQTAPDPLAQLERAAELLATAGTAVDIPSHIKPAIAIADAVAVIARQIGLGLVAQNHAAALKLRAEHRGGQLLTQAGVGSGKKPSLGFLGVDDHQSARWQQIARLPLDTLEAYIAETAAAGAELTSAGARALAASLDRPAPAPEPGSRPSRDTPLLRACPPDMSTAAIVASILRVAFPDARTALDMTYGLGGFWDGSAHVRVTATDQSTARSPDSTSDFRSLHWPDAAFDVAVFDPPHVADGGRESIMAQRFGTYTTADLEHAIRAGSAEAWRVARVGVVVKVTDGVHGQRYVAESDWVRESIKAPLYDVVHQIRTGAVIDPKWGEQLSAYNNLSTYLVLRKDGDQHVRRDRGLT